MKKLISYIILVGLAVLVFYLWQTPKADNVSPLETPETIEANLQINFVFDNQRTVSLEYPYSAEINLLDITKNIAEQQNWQFQSQDYGEMGILVTQIDDKINGQENSYWQYYANNEQVMISANNYFPIDDEYIEWKFQASEF